MNDAIRNLREREGISAENYETIGYVNLLNGKVRSSLPEVAERVKNWARQMGLQAVIWTDLPVKGVSFGEGSTGREIESIRLSDQFWPRNLFQLSC